MKLTDAPVLRIYPKAFNAVPLSAEIVALVLACCLSGAARAQDAGPIRIGFIAPLTGGSANMGNSALVGAKVAINEINEVGG